ncbi:MAG TPA: phage shock protein PspA [Oceanospirillaceae bacterium]|nr:phage shock protein PspA [Oceanospirillaceae bacterium]
MGIFSRMTDIINSNLSALLDRAEDPSKMIRLIIQEMEETLVEVRSSSARIIADKKTAQRKLEQLQAHAQEWEDKAALALEKDREDLARAALQEQANLSEEALHMSAELEAADEHLAHLSEEVSQLQSKLNDAKAKQKSLLVREKSVNDRIRVKQQTQRDALDKAFSKFDHYERRMDNLEGQLEAMDLGRDGDLASQIDALQADERITDALAKLKAKRQPATP